MSKSFWNSLAIAAAIAIPTISVGALESAAQSYGSIARSPSTHDKGYSWNYSSRAAAANRAINECESVSGAGDCEVLISDNDACISLAESRNGAAGTGSSVDEYEAENLARQVCRDYGGTRCSVTRTICLPY